MDHSQDTSIVNWHAMLMQHCLQNRLGFVPDVEPWYSAELIAHVLGIELATLRNKKILSRLRHHAIGRYYRLSEVLTHAGEIEETPEDESGER